MNNKTRQSVLPYTHFIPQDQYRSSHHPYTSLCIGRAFTALSLPLAFLLLLIPEPSGPWGKGNLKTSPLESRTFTPLVSQITSHSLHLATLASLSAIAVFLAFLAVADPDPSSEGHVSSSNGGPYHTNWITSNEGVISGLDSDSKTPG